MKLLKKLMVVFLAVMMVMSLASKVYAEEPTTGSVTVEPANVGQTYTLYKLFDAEISFSPKEGTDPVEYKQDAITYKLPAGKELGTTGQQWFKINDNGFVVLADSMDEAKLKEVMKTSAFKDWAKGIASTVKEPITAETGKTVKWTEVPFGYYFVDSTLGAFIGVDSNNPDVVIADKNEVPKVDKEITGVGTEKDTSSLGVGDETTDPGQGANEKAIAQVGDPVSYKLTVSAKPGAENYVVTDTLSPGLTAPTVDNVSVKVNGAALVKDTDYSISIENNVIRIVFSKTYLDSITTATNIVIEYTAVLNKDAVIGVSGNPNTVKLTWGHSPNDDVNYSEDDSKVYTAQVEIQKNDNSSPAKPLSGAGFVVKNNTTNKYFKFENGVVTWVDAIADATQHDSGADGKVPPFTGLKNGSYTLVETVVPSGYNKLDDQTFTIADKDYTDTNLKKEATVVNNKGAELPSTGGIGTTIFHFAGAALVLGAGILLISKKRMNNN